MSRIFLCTERVCLTHKYSNSTTDDSICNNDKSNIVDDDDDDGEEEEEEDGGGGGDDRVGQLSLNQAPARINWFGHSVYVAAVPRKNKADSRAMRRSKTNASPSRREPPQQLAKLLPADLICSCKFKGIAAVCSEPP
eukprot:565859-Pelagomonas_calceolata.AAC.3